MNAVLRLSPAELLNLCAEFFCYSYVILMYYGSSINKTISTTHSAAICARLCRFYIRLLQDQCLMIVASAPQGCSFLVQTAIGQHAEVYSSIPAETPSGNFSNMLDLA